MIGEEGDVDVSKVDANVLVDGFDEKVFDHFGGKILDRFKSAELKDMTVWVDPLDGTQVTYFGRLHEQNLPHCNYPTIVIIKAFKT